VSSTGNESNITAVTWLGSVFGRKPQSSRSRHEGKRVSGSKIMRQQKMKKQQDDAMAALAVHVCRNAMHPFMPGIMDHHHEAILEHRSASAASHDLALAGVRPGPAQAVLHKCLAEGGAVAAIFVKARTAMRCSGAASNMGPAGSQSAGGVGIGHHVQPHAPS